MSISGNITDYDIQALIDGQTKDPFSLKLLEAIRQDPILYNRYLLYKKQKALLKFWWKDN